MPGEQEHHISSVPFFFFITYKITTCERTLIHAPSAPEKAPQNLRHYANETMDTYLISVKLEQVNAHISNTNNRDVNCTKMLIKSGGFSICVKGQRTGKHIDFAKACVLE